MPPIPPRHEAGASPVPHRGYSPGTHIPPSFPLNHLSSLDFLTTEGFTLGKATKAPYPMPPRRIQSQAMARDPVKGGLDLYGTRGLPFHVGGASSRAKSLWRRLKETR